MAVRNISGWLLIILVTLFYLKETALNYWFYIGNKADVEGIMLTEYLPFLLFALGAFIIALGMYILIFLKLFKPKI
uniref:DUF3955 domain-containing protein n=2 Tax=Vibrionaceae TaxID=641 RepID=A0A0H3ZKV6_VIBSP|nr:hypothetical protein [Vibrio splendidus]AKN40570.1 hypothetical protein [Enterovibrio norvegicus]